MQAQKHYHFDWTVVPGEPQRLENLVAAHLLKWVHFQQDSEGFDLELRYFRDRDYAVALPPSSWSWYWSW